MKGRLIEKFLWGFIFILAVVFQVSLSWSELADVNTSIGEDDVLELNNATPGMSKTFLGTRLRGPLAQGSTTYAAGDNGNPGVNEYATPTTTVFLKTTGAVTGESYRLGNAYPGYRLTVVLVTDGGKDFRVTPKTKTGFTDVQLDDAKDSCTLKYIDSTVGYVVDGNAGCVIN